MGVWVLFDESFLGSELTTLGPQRRMTLLGSFFREISTKHLELEQSLLAASFSVVEGDISRLATWASV
jgi:hypothetical protein